MASSVHQSYVDAVRQQLEREQSQAPRLLDEILGDAASPAWRARCFCIGYLWHDEQRPSEELTRLGVELASGLQQDAAAVINELWLGYAASREDRRAREWEHRLVRRVAELDGLHRIISAANSSLDLQASLQTVAQIVTNVMGTDVCSIFLFDRNTGELTLRATHGLDPGAVGHVVVRIGEGATGWAAQEGQPLVIEDVHSDPRFKVTPLLDERPYRSMICVPIILFAGADDAFSDQLQGVISVQERGVRVFSEEEKHFLEVVAGELAFSIANAQRYQETDEQLHQKIRELSTLQHVTAAIAATLDLGSVLSMIAEQVVRLSSSDRADIFECDEEGQNCRLITSWGGHWDERLRRVIMRTVTEGHPVAIVSAYDDMRFPELAALAYSEGYHSLFCIPLRIGERIIGAIALFTKEQRYFSYEQVQMLSTFADEAAIAIENARLFKETQQNLKIKSTLLQEMHHRVRNNLQTVAALLSLQLRSAEDAPWATELREAISRIQAIATVHDLLSDEERLGGTTVDIIARHVAEDAYSTLIPPHLAVDFEIEPTELTVPSRQATVLSLAINELISNAISHGFKNRTKGLIRFRAWRNRTIASIEVFNDGHRVPDGFNPAQSTGLGMRIVQRRGTSDLRGDFAIRSNDDGTVARISFPLASNQETEALVR